MKLTSQIIICKNQWSVKKFNIIDKTYKKTVQIPYEIQEGQFYPKKKLCSY